MNVLVRSCRMAAVAAMCAIGWCASAQVMLSGEGSKDGGSAVTNAGMVQRLEAGSYGEEGCFPPCQCIVHHIGPARGVWRMTPMGSTTNGMLEFRVDEVEWIVGWNTLGEQRVRGRGVYRVSHPALASPLPARQQLVLELSVNDQPARRFDSGLVTTSAVFPRIEATISANNMVCYDTVFHVRSGPVPAREVAVYGLRGATFMEGCYPPCLCPISSRPVEGTMLVVPMRGVSVAPTNANREFGVLNVRWRFASALAPSLNETITGSGLWIVGPPSAIPETQERLALDLRLPGEAASRFDSGLVLVAAPPPVMDLMISEHGMVCLDRVFHVRAGPLRASAAPSGSVAD